MRYLLSSILCVMCFSCASYPKKNGFQDTVNQEQHLTNPYFANATKDYIYKANIEAFGNSFSGIFIAKKLGENHHRIAFTTEMGNKIFDFSYQDDNFKVNHILKKMDKKILIHILKNDFKVLITENPSVEKTYSKNQDRIYETLINPKKYYHFVSDGKLYQILKASNGTEKVKFIFSEITNDQAKEIQILHQNMKLNIILKAL